NHSGQKIYGLVPPQEPPLLLRFLPILVGPFGPDRRPLGPVRIIDVGVAIAVGFPPVLGAQNLAHPVTMSVPRLLALLVTEPLPTTLGIEVSSAVFALHLVVSV